MKRLTQFYTLVALLLAWFSSVQAFAARNCASNAVFTYRDQQDISSLIENVLDIEGSPRLRPDEYAKENGLTNDEVDKNFGATGSLECKAGKSSANIVGKRGLALASAHAFWNQETCEPKNQPQDCVFKTFLGGKEVTRNVKGIRASGFKCPDHKPGPEDDWRTPQPEDDWVILDLEKPVPEAIEPYVVGDAGRMSVGDPVLGINGQNADFFRKDPATGKRTWSKSIAPCQWGELVNRWVSASCSGSSMSSGSGLLNRDRELVGLLVQGTETREQLIEALKKKPFVANSCKYDKLTCSTYYVPVQGALKSALDEAISTTDL